MLHEGRKNNEVEDVEYGWFQFL